MKISQITTMVSSLTHIFKKCVDFFVACKWKKVMKGGCSQMHNFSRKCYFYYTSKTFSYIHVIGTMRLIWPHPQCSVRRDGSKSLRLKEAWMFSAYVCTIAPQLVVTWAWMKMASAITQNSSNWTSALRKLRLKMEVKGSSSSYCWDEMECMIMSNQI